MTAPQPFTLPTHPNDELQAVYVEVPKAGCTSIKAAMSPLMKGVEWQRKEHGSVHELWGYHNLRDVDDLYDHFDTVWKDYYKFTVVRHPVVRFVSLYRTKIAADPVTLEGMNNFVLNHFEDGPWFENAHGCSQTRLIGTELGRFDFVGRVEKMGRMQKVLSQHFKRTIVIPHLNRAAKEPTNTWRLSPEARRKLRELFAVDLKVLGY